MRYVGRGPIVRPPVLLLNCGEGMLGKSRSVISLGRREREGASETIELGRDAFLRFVKNEVERDRLPLIEGGSVGRTG